ncbi:TonB-dependent receptor [Telmatobacter bradus]|uniref:TonB-dependent receptor n=1 Tax=Telmatobacter bradus TaxID=474953 RepID=UPI003B433C1E
MHLRHTLSAFLLPLAFTGAAFAQQSASLPPDTAQKNNPQPKITTSDTIVVTAPGEDRVEQEIPLTVLKEETAGTSPIKSLSQMPSVNYQSADSFGSYEWAVRISVRGFNQNQLGFTLDDVPLGDMSYGNWNGLHISRAVIDENLDHIALSQGAGALETASNSNLGGTMQFYSSDPSDQKQFTASQSFGSFNSYRTYARYDSGLIGGKTKFYLSGVENKTQKWRGQGDIGQNYWQFNGKLVHYFNKGELTAYVDLSDRREVDYQDSAISWIPTLGYKWDNYGDWNTATTQAYASAAAYAADGWNNCGVSGTKASAYGFVGSVGNMDASADPCDAAYFGGSGLRRDVLTYVSLKLALTDKLTLKSTIYGHGNDGAGLWFLPTAEYGQAVYQTLLATTGSPLAMRASEYGIQRGGFLTSLTYETDHNKFEAGGWYEKEHFNLARRFYTVGANGPERSLHGFPVNPFYVQWAYGFDMNLFQIHAQDSYKVNDRLKVSAGFKTNYNFDTGKVNAYDTGTLNVYGASINTTGLMGYTASSFAQGSLTAGKPFLPQFGADYKLDKHSDLFADAAYNVRTYQAGGKGFGNAPWGTTQAHFDALKKTIKPETSWTEEAGYRLTNKHVGAQMSYFHVNYFDRLVSFGQGCEGCGVASTLGNAGSVTTNGVDGAVTLELGPLFTLYNSVTWNRSTYDDNVNYTDSNGNAADYATAGKVNVDTPEFLYKSSLEVHKSGAFARLGDDFMSKRYYTYLNDNSVPNRFLTEFGAGYKRASLGAFSDVKIQFNVANLMNSQYWASIGTNNFPYSDASGTDNTLQVGAPRAFSGMLSVSF